MASQYTDNSGIELIGVGEQSGTWGTTTNNNLEIIDKVLNGVTDTAVTGNINIGVTDGDKTSNGHTRVLVLTGSLGSGVDATITPATREAFYIVHNKTGQTITFKQGTGGDVSNGRAVEVPNLAKAFIYADGKDSGAAVVDLLSNVVFGGTLVTTTAAQLLSTTATTAELNLMDGSATTAGTDAVAAGDGIVTNDGGTMKQTTAATFSTYFNQNLVEVKSLATISSALNVIAGGATSVYQQVVISSGTQTINVQTDNLVAGQYVIIDKKTSANKMTINWNAGDGSTALSGGNVSTGLTLGDSVDFAVGVFNGSSFSFSETVKF